MSRSSSPALRWSAIGVFLALAAAVVWSAAPASVDAQNSLQPTAALTVSEPSPEHSFRTVALGLQVGNVGLAAISGDLTYDANAITVLSCEISEAGACNAAEPGTVRMTAFAASGMSDNDRVMTVNFQAVVGASGSSSFAFEVTEAVNLVTANVDPMSVEPIAVVLTEPEFGSLTGDVVAADTEIGVYQADVCVVHTATGDETCTTTSGLGAWRIDDLVAGAYAVTISDPSATYGPAETATLVNGDTITTGVDAVLDFPVIEDEAVEDDTAADESPTSEVIEDSPLEISYGASISGKLYDRTTAQALEGMTVCATQPFVLHQSCSSTDPAGDYTLSNLSAGNYWITVVDPLGQYEDSPVDLVGLSTDTADRSGVWIPLDRIGG